MTVPSAAAWIGVPHTATRSIPVWNMGRPRSGWIRGPNGEVSPPATGWMKRGPRATIGAMTACAVAGAIPIAGNRKRPPPMAAVEKTGSTGAMAAVGARAGVERASCWRA
jgi:hypothetical protein